MKSRYGRSHIKVAEKALGRKLPKGSVVHHADGNPSNNANNNLEFERNWESARWLMEAIEKAFDEKGTP